MQQHKTNATALADNKDALTLAMIRCKRADYIEGPFGLKEALPFLFTWRRMGADARAMFLRHAKADGTFTDPNGGR
jgi:hypothetical protein